jgi:hypothetical protein
VTSDQLILRRARAWAKAKRRHTAAWTAPDFDVVEHSSASAKLARAEKLLLDAIPQD